MLKKMEGLPIAILGIQATGKLTREDYEKTFVPLLEEAHRLDQRVRLLYLLGPDYSGFTPGAMWEDFRVGVKYLRVFEKCAVVSDVEWVRVATHLFGPLMPCPARVFETSELKEAIEWLGTEADSKRKTA